MVLRGSFVKLGVPLVNGCMPIALGPFDFCVGFFALRDGCNPLTAVPGLPVLSALLCCEVSGAVYFSDGKCNGLEASV